MKKALKYAQKLCRAYYLEKHEDEDQAFESAMEALLEFEEETFRKFDINKELKNYKERWNYDFMKYDIYREELKEEGWFMSEQELNLCKKIMKNAD